MLVNEGGMLGGPGPVRGAPYGLNMGDSGQKNIP